MKAPLSPKLRKLIRHVTVQVGVIQRTSVAELQKPERMAACRCSLLLLAAATHCSYALLLRAAPTRCSYALLAVPWTAVSPKEIRRNRSKVDRNLRYFPGKFERKVTTAEIESLP